MSDAVFPTLAGIAWPIVKKPRMKTLTQKSLSGKEKRAQLYTSPEYEIKLTFSYLPDSQQQSDDFHSLLGFFLSRAGAFDDFLFLDAYDHTLVNQVIGIGDGSTKVFQMIRNTGGFIEPILGLTAAPTIAIGGITTTSFTWTSRGVITFTTAPGVGLNVTASGNWYYRCRFLKDENEFNNFYYSFWELDTCELITLK